MIPKGKKKTLTVTLDGHALASINANLPGLQIETGIYDIHIGASSRDIRLSGKVSALSVGKRAPIPDYTGDAPSYYSVPSNGVPIPRVQFEKVYGRPVVASENPRKGAHSMNSTVSEITDTRFGSQIAWYIKRSITKQYKSEPREDQIRMMEAMTDDMRDQRYEKSIIEPAEYSLNPQTPSPGVFVSLEKCDQQCINCKQTMSIQLPK